MDPRQRLEGTGIRREGEIASGGSTQTETPAEALTFLDSLKRPRQAERHALRGDTPRSPWSAR
jgi:hypothetical protein